MIPERMRPPGCISDLVFDAWFAGELAFELEAPMEAHVGRCLRCRSRRGALQTARAAFLAQRPNYVASANQLARRHRRKLLAGSALVAMALLGSLAVLARERESDGDLSAEFTPPTAAATQLGFVVERGAGVQRGESGQDVRPTDVVRFEYSSPISAYIAIYGLDAHGAVRVYYPESEVGAPVGAGDQIPLSTTVKATGAFGVERVVGLFCDVPFTVADHQRTLQLQKELVPPPGCEVSAIDWNRTQY